MHLFTIDGLEVAVGLVLQVALLIVLFQKRLVRGYPALTLYLIFSCIEDCTVGLFDAASQDYVRFYFATTILDYLVQILIIAEIGRAVVRPAKRSVPFRIAPIATVAGLVCIIIAASFSPAVQLSSLQQASQIFFRVTLGLAVFKVLFFAVLAAFAQFLGIGWKNHALQLASGLAFYGAVSLFAQLGISHAQTLDHATYVARAIRLSQLQSVAYVSMLFYWTLALSRNEAPRKEFTPQMQQVLVTIAGTAKRTRLAVTRSPDHK